MDKKLLLLYNVKAGRRQARRKLDAIEQIFSAAGYTPIPKMLRFGENPFDNIQEEISLVVVCGGDGTVNYVLNAMRAKGIDYPLGIIPAGTANDFAGAIGMHSNIIRAAQQIAKGSEHRVDCGVVNGQYFINIFSFGMFTTTSQHTPEHIKRHIGKAAYLIEGSKELHNREFIPLHIVHDNGELDVDSMITLIFNGETAGRIPLARHASINDGMLDCFILRKCNTFSGAWNTTKFLISGNPNDEIMHIRTSKLQITSPLSPLTDMDGQPGPEFPLTIECLPLSLRIVM